MLTEKQQLTIEHLKSVGIIEVKDIISWCVEKIHQPRKVLHKSRMGRRKRGRQYYQEILNHYAQGKE